MPSPEEGGKRKGFEIEIEGDQDAPGGDAGLIDGIIAPTRQTFVENSINIMPSVRDNGGESRIEVLVQLESHAPAVLTWIGITRSRVISAAYASAAETSSGLS